MNIYLFMRPMIVIEHILKVSRMGLLGNALKRIRRGFPKMDFMKNKHEDCANFDNGTCKVFHFTNLDPKGQACPHFKAKKNTKTESRTNNLKKEKKT